MNAAHQKVAASHLSRDAYLYVRQSTQRQVFDHGESTRRQYALRERAVALGWPTESIGRDRQRSRSLRPTPTARDSSIWSPRSAWAGPGSCSGSRCPGSRATSTDWHRLLRDLRAERDADP